MSKVLSNGARIYRAAMLRLLGPRILRFLLLSLIFNALFAVLALCACAFVFSGEPVAVIDHGASFFLVPALLLGWISTVLILLMLPGLVNGRSLVQWSLLILTIVIVATLWLAAMHAGTWLEWRQKRTPLAWGSEWFYAEVYNAYLQEPGGLAIVCMTALTVSWPVLGLLIAAALSRGVRKPTTK